MAGFTAETGPSPPVPYQVRCRSTRRATPRIVIAPSADIPRSPAAFGPVESIRAIGRTGDCGPCKTLQCSLPAPACAAPPGPRLDEPRTRQAVVAYREAAFATPNLVPLHVRPLPTDPIPAASEPRQDAPCRGQGAAGAYGQSWLDPPVAVSRRPGRLLGSAARAPRQAPNRFEPRRRARSWARSTPACPCRRPTSSVPCNLRTPRPTPPVVGAPRHRWRPQEPTAKTHRHGRDADRRQQGSGRHRGQCGEEGARPPRCDPARRGG